MCSSQDQEDCCLWYTSASSFAWHHTQTSSRTSPQPPAYNYLDQQHTVYLDEIQEQLLSRHGVKVSIPTLTRTLHRLHFSHKQVSGKALERNDRLRAVYMNWIADLVPDPNMLMFGDEVAKDERTSNRRKGWSCQGMRCVQWKCFVQGKRFSVLPILTLDGIIAHNIIEGLVTSEWFVEFLWELVVSADWLFSVNCTWLITL